LQKGITSRQKKVTKREELAPAVKEMMESKEAYFLEVCVEKEDNVFPMIPSGASVSDIRLE
jgi:acetolactate synthase-1/2/3 large subunit